MGCKSKPGQVKQALGEELQPRWANGAFNLVPGLTEEIWRVACMRPEHKVTLSVQDVIILPEDKDDVLAELLSVPCRQRTYRKTSKPCLSLANPEFTELFKDESDAEDIAESLVGSWQSKYGTYMINMDANGDLVFREDTSQGEIAGILRRAASGFWEADVYFQIDGVYYGDLLGLMRIRPTDSNDIMLLTQTMLAGGSGWSDCEVVHATRQAVPSWAETLRLAVESAPIVHLNLESNGVFLAGPEEEPVVTPRSAAAASAPGSLDPVRLTTDVNPRIWQR